MFCTKCGAELPAGTEYCPSCGARVGGAAPAAGDAAGSAAAAESAAATGTAPSDAAPANAQATPGTVPPAVPEPAPVRKKPRKRAAIAAICVVGVLAAGGAALALTGAFGPLGQGSSSKITQIGSVEGSAEHKDKGSAQEEPAAQEEAQEPEQDQNASSVKVDINDQATYAAANLFLSNFTEEHFDRDWYQAGGFDSTDGLSDDEKYKLVKFIWCHLIDNAPYRIEKGDYSNGHYQRAATDEINKELNRLTGLMLSDADMTYDRAPSGQMIPDNAEAHDGYLYLSQEYGQANYNPPCAIVTGATDLGDNTYELTYEVYSAGGTMLVSDIPESTYGLPKDQYIAAIQADASKGRTETCTVRVTQGDGAPSFTLLKMGVYDS